MTLTTPEIDLIGEIKSASARFTNATIVLSFDDRAVFVLDTLPDPATRLEDLLDQGATPIGILSFKRRGQQLTVYGKTFEAENRGRHAHMQRVSEEVRQPVTESGAVAISYESFN